MLVGVLWLAMSGVATAADNGLYLGASVGQVKLKFDDLAGISTADFDGEDTAFKVIAGFRPLDWLAVEAAYVDFGNPDDVVLGERFEAELDGISAFGVGMFALGPVDLFGKAGLVDWDSNFQGALDNEGTDLAYGAGAQFRVWSISLRAEYEVFDVGDADDLSMVSIGVTYTFL